MSKTPPPPAGFPLGNQDPSKRGLGRTQKQMRKANKSGCVLSLLCIGMLGGAFYASLALILSILG